MSNFILGLLIDRTLALIISLVIAFLIFKYIRSINFTIKIDQNLNLEIKNSKTPYQIKNKDILKIELGEVHWGIVRSFTNNFKTFYNEKIYDRHGIYTSLCLCIYYNNKDLIIIPVSYLDKPFMEFISNNYKQQINFSSENYKQFYNVNRIENIFSYLVPISIILLLFYVTFSAINFYWPWLNIGSVKDIFTL